MSFNEVTIIIRSVFPISIKKLIKLLVKIGRKKLDFKINKKKEKKFTKC